MMLDARGNICYTILSANYAGVMELADVPDSKSGGSDTVRVRPPATGTISPQALSGLRCFFYLVMI